MDLGLRGDRYIEIDELEVLKQRIGEFLKKKNPVKVDGAAPRLQPFSAAILAMLSQLTGSMTSPS